MEGNWCIFIKFSKVLYMKAATAAIAATAGRATAAAERAPALVALTVGAAAEAEAFIEPEAE